MKEKRKAHARLLNAKKEISAETMGLDNMNPIVASLVDANDIEVKVINMLS